MLVGIRSTLLPPDPVAALLTWAGMATSLSKGLFYSVSALFFTRSVGLAPTTVGWGLAVAGAVGVGSAFAAGYVADRIGAARLLVVATVGQGLALLAYVVALDTAAFVITAACAVGLQSVQQTARQTVLAQSFTGADRVEVRARLRVVTNVFIGMGTALAAVALLADSAVAYRTAMVVAGVLVLAAGGPLARLDRGAARCSRERAGLPIAVPPEDGEQQVRSASGRSPLRDRTYLAAAALNAVMTMHFGLQTVGVPLWVAGHTHAPPVTLSALLLLNTALVALLQVRAARASDSLRTAGRLVARAGGLLALACGLYASAGHGSAPVAVGLLVLAVLAHTAAEVWCEAGSWSLAFELADDRNPGAYQGVAQTGYALGAMLAPLVVTATAIDHGGPGWLSLASVFLAAGTLTATVATRAERTRRAPACSAPPSAPARQAGP